MWTWTNWLAVKARESGKELLLLNLDETSIPVTFTHAGGNVMLLDPTKNWHRPPRQGATRSERRTYFTHVALICNDVALQPKLPQVLFIGDKHLTLAASARIQSTLPDNVYVKRLPKGWNNAQEHCVIIRLLGMILAPVLDRYQPVLMFDAVGLHLAAEVMEELTLARLWYVVIPARLTFLLQPLDTHGFAKYKRHLKKRFQDRLAGPEDSNVTEHMVGLVVETIRVVLQGNRWAHAFTSNGLDGHQSGVSTYIKNNLEFEMLPPYLPTRPSLAHLRVCWPRNRVPDAAVVYQPMPAAEPDVEMLALPGVPPAILPPEPDEEDLAVAEPLAAIVRPESEGGSPSSVAAGAGGHVESIDAVPPLELAAPPRVRLRQKSSSALGG